MKYYVVNNSRDPRRYAYCDQSGRHVQWRTTNSRAIAYPFDDQAMARAVALFLGAEWSVEVA